ncbi:1-aminocyclopropane-1-carboxylate deaminase/D-cysteine desulfhydrase [Burkholderia ubonensis]|uniref:1-aminocyclopropane-1-carboxylate deaminase n=1 Tax=Burkholderia ubonensis subsp. mesacidophila TaxID=265293 RepID=A0A2A4FEG5_9BURK|nr:pyridoxal-phosphate dependent enzyme [Burkholderia ubonensis]PCE30709.1 1-aminocyclopropane-1-carboxylate deaminase [Burkholderia ubonensis subsp. mesacidophila]
MSRVRLLPELVPELDALVRPLDLLMQPTPVTEEPALARRWGQAGLWIKRDDLTNPLYGGSKVRALEFLLGKARMEGADGVVTMGPYGSHQMLATAVFGRQTGFLTRGVMTPQPDVPEVELNRRLLPAFGMEVMRCGSFAAVPATLLRARLTRLGAGRPFWIPPGANHPLGVMSAVEGALEVVQAIRAGSMPAPDDVVVPTGTCATAAGVYLGFALGGIAVRVVAVRMVPMIVTGPAKLLRMARQTERLLRRHGLSAPARWGELLWVNAHAAPGYGRAGVVAERARADVAQLGAFRTEATYTAKTLALLAGGGLQRRRVLFWNTYSAIDPDPSREVADTDEFDDGMPFPHAATTTAPWETPN